MKPQKAEMLALKKRLRKLRDDGFELENQMLRLEWAEHNMIGVGSPMLSDMPKNPSPSNDRLVNALNKKMEIEAEIDHISEGFMRERRVLGDAIANIGHSDYRAVLRMRYFDRLEWEDIVRMMYSKRKDYYDNSEKYHKAIFKVHGNALVELLNVLKNF